GGAHPRRVGGCGSHRTARGRRKRGLGWDYLWGTRPLRVDGAVADGSVSPTFSHSIEPRRGVSRVLGPDERDTEVDGREADAAHGVRDDAAFEYRRAFNEEIRPRPIGA